MSISFDGIGEVTATFRLEEDSGVKTGDVVCVTGDGEVGLGAAGGQFFGVALSVSEDGYAGVQLNGLVEVAYSGATTPVPGWEMLATDGTGCVTVVEQDGMCYLVVSVDEEAGKAVIRL